MERNIPQGKRMTTNKTVLHSVGAPPVSAFDPPLLSGSLAPLLAGARARGMADAFELLGLAAVLLDGDGLALHASARANRLFGRALDVSPQGRLRFADLATDAALQARVNRALCGDDDETAPIVLARGEGRPAMLLRIVPVNAADDSAQLLRAVVLIECDGGPPNAALY
jgi:hypothetical protein